MCPEATEALKKIEALRRLTVTTGTITRKAEASILRSLGDQAMIEVALAVTQPGVGVDSNQKPISSTEETRRVIPTTTTAR